MEKINKEVNDCHRQLISHISKIYSDISKNMNQSYLTGKKDGYEEILNWLISTNNLENKYISPNSFYNMIMEKNIKTKIALNAKNEDDDNDSKLHFENKKKLHRNPTLNFNSDNSSTENNSFVPFSIATLLNTTNTDNNGDNSDEVMNGNNGMGSPNPFYGCNLKRKK